MRVEEANGLKNTPVCLRLWLLFKLLPKKSIIIRCM